MAVHPAFHGLGVGDYLLKEAASLPSPSSLVLVLIAVLRSDERSTSTGPESSCTWTRATSQLSACIPSAHSSNLLPLLSTYTLLLVSFLSFRQQSPSSWSDLD
eukprot:767688-Hanusia_phi.AAC.14